MLFQGFNTQPPEGGWPNPSKKVILIKCFNTQPPEGGWGSIIDFVQPVTVSTHSRLKAAGTVTAIRCVQT